MKNKNICKFIPSGISEKLETFNFIYESDRETMAHTQDLEHHRAYLVTEGGGVMTLNGEDRPFERAELIFAFSGESVSVLGESCEYMYISFGGARADELFRRFGIDEKNRSFGAHEGLIPLWRESLARADEKTLDLAAESALLYAFSRLSSGADKRDDLISRTLEILEDSFSDSDLSVSSVAAELGYNAKYFSHAFKGKMGVGFSEYLKSLRIKNAVFLFDHGIESVKNVAFLSGFSDPLYFSSVFKDVLGISPKEYIKRKCAD